MILEAFVADELNRLRTERNGQIDPLVASFLANRTGSRPRGMRKRIGASLIRAGARMAGARVDDCLERVAGAAPAHV